MTKNLLRFFACTHVSDDREGANWHRYVWEEDTDVECYEGHHALLLGVLVVPLFLAVSFGFPVAVIVILTRNRCQLNQEDFVQTFGFLYGAYDRYYWEVIVMLRKAVIAAIAVFAYRLGSILQGLMCVLVIVVALSVHLAAQPFTQEIPQLNHLETCSLAATIVVFVAGLMMNDEKVEQSDRIVLSAMAILFVCLAVVATLVQLVYATEESMDMKLIELEAMEIQRIIDAHLHEKAHALLQHYAKTAAEAVKTLRCLLNQKLRIQKREDIGEEVRSISLPRYESC